MTGGQALRQQRKVLGDFDGAHELLALLSEDTTALGSLVVLRNEDGHVEDLLRGWTLLWVDLEQGRDHTGQIRRKGCRYLRIDTLDDSIVETLHILGREGWAKCDHLVEDCSKRPDIGRFVIGLILPHLRRCVVGRSRLGLHNCRFGDLADIQIAQLDSATFRQKDVSALDISVDDLSLVEGVESIDHLVENAPDVFFLKVSVRFLVLINLRLKVAAIRILHHDTELIRLLLEECIFIASNVLVAD